MIADTVSAPLPDADYSSRVSGPDYKLFLANLHAVLTPRTYLEVGTSTGATLAMAECDSLAVDPRFSIASDVIGKKTVCLLFQEPSDRFFARRDPIAMLGAPVDLAFLDGMHLFEFLLRDFINTERVCRSNSVVVLHDCVAPGFYMTARSPTAPSFRLSQFGEWWTGDVWKLVPALKKYRPDLSMTLVDNRPTGLVLMSNLDPENTVLIDNYRQIVSEFAQPADERQAFDAYWADLHVRSADELQRLDQLAPLFWL